MVSEYSTCTVQYCCARRVFCCCCFWEQRVAPVCGVRHNFQNYMQYGAETKERFCANQNTKESCHIQNTPTSKKIFSFMETPYMDLRAGPTRKVIRPTSRLCNPQNTHAPPRRDRGCQSTCFDILLRMSAVVGCLASNGDWRSRRLKKYLKFESTRMDMTGLSRCKLSTLTIN